MLEIKITKEAQKILFSAAEDNGQIIKVSTICGTTIQAGMFSIELGDLTPRERADWEYALEELLYNKLIRDLGYKKELFELTKLGFDFFDENAINIKSEEIDIKSENNIKIGTVVYDNEGNNYKVIKNIDSGGCGQVYKIKRLSDNNIFALKTINNDDALETIENEMSLAIQIDSPNVVKYIYFNKNQFNLPPYIIMEYIDGENLGSILKNNNEFLDNSILLNYYKQICCGMKAINERLVHRDIKLENILISKNGEVKITDFGISKPTDIPTRDLTFKGWGTPKYISPEGWKLEKNTIQMDIYSMGIVFYELATLKYPYIIKLGTEEEYRKAHLSQPVTKPSDYNSNLPTYVETMIMRMLMKEPLKRYSSFSEILSFLDNNQDSKPSDFIQNLLKKRISYDVQKSNDEIIKKKETAKKIEEEDIIGYSFEYNILNPLKEYIQQFNKAYSNGEVKITGIRRGDNISYDIVSIEGKRTRISMRIIKNEIFKQKFRSPFGGSYFENEYYEKEYRPTLKQKEILAWGKLVKEDDSGINLYLVYDENNMYGTWYYSITTNSAFSTERRIEPIYFDYDEIEREISCFNAMHIYNTKVEKLDNIDNLCEYIDFCNC